MLAGALALLALGAGRPAAADPKFLEEYPDIFGARTLQYSPGNTTPGNALQGPSEEGRDRLIVVSPFFRSFSPEHGDIFLAGGGIAYAHGARSQNPWEVYLDFFNAHVDPDFASSSDSFGYDVNGKFVVWGGYHREYDYTGPVVSIFGRWQEIQDFGHRWDLGIALDQQVSKQIYATANLSYSESDPNGNGNGKKNGSDGKERGPVAGFGLTWLVTHQWSLSGDYVIDNDVDGQDSFGVSLAYMVNRDFSVRLGGGTHGSVFGNILWRWRGH